MNRWVNTADFSLKQIAGAALKDAPQLLANLSTQTGWIAAKNRQESLSSETDGPGFRCDFQWSSAIHACRVFPPLGSMLMRRALAQWPIDLASTPRPAVKSTPPDLSFIIPFRGTKRLPQLQATVRSILAQRDVQVECIVVEQSNLSQARNALPAGARYLHLPHSEGDEGWRKSWAYNVAARAARADVLVCHDGDILVPIAYGKAILSTLGRGFDSVHIQRFLFYLGSEASGRVQAGGSLDGCCPETVLHNWLGGTLAIRRDSFFDIGGFDERFVDWGGEDDEFFSRCSALRQCRHGFVPFVHLWHPRDSRKTASLGLRARGLCRF